MDYFDRKSGFTLIELSIVLVIIGLIVGGVLVGRDLIHAAEIRATVAQVEKFNAAVNTFRTKYNGLPGDMPNPGNFGFDAATAGNGDGEIGLCTIRDSCQPSPANSAVLGHEHIDFWYQLAAANLIEGAYRPYYTYGVGPIYAGIGTPAAKMKQPSAFMPGSPGGWVISSDATFSMGMGDPLPSNTFILGGLSALPSINIGGYPPIDIFNIDNKMDDGLPITGMVRAYTTIIATTVGNPSPPPVTISFFAMSPTAAACGGGAGPGCVCSDTTPYTYDTAKTDLTWPSTCSAVIHAAF